MMTIQEDVLFIMMEQSPGWASTAEGFLDFIIITDYLSKVPLGLQDPNGPGMCPSAKELGEIFLKVLNINLGRYESFDVLCEVVPSKEALMKKAAAIVSRASEEEDVMSLIEDGNIMPSEDTIEDQVRMDILASKIIDKLRPYIHIV